MLTRRQKILGSLYGAAIADSMGAATETRSREYIKKDLGYVTELLETPEGTYNPGTAAGIVTDDFSMAFVTLREILDAGEINNKVVNDALLKWSKMEVYARCAGPTTRSAIGILKGEFPVFQKWEVTLCNNRKTSNGAAMKIGPTGLLTPGNISAAVDNAISVGMPSHGNPVALSGASAVCAAVSAAMEPNACHADVIAAGVYGAKEGYDRSQPFAQPAAAPSVLKRIQLAVEIGNRYSDNGDKAIEEIADIIGMGLATAEAVPACFGFIAAAPGDPNKAIHLAVNAGDDTDTVATMIGAIVGALYGVDSFPEHQIKLIKEMNSDFDLEQAADDIEKNLDVGNIITTRREF